MTTTNHSDTVPHVAVLGTGRMGAAMAARLAPSFPVVTWTRSGRGVPAVEAAPSAAAAVKDADVVLLALFDAQASGEVLAACLSDLRGESVLVNTTTVGPNDAAALARLVEDAGHHYLHAPVMGSVPAVEAGTLTVLAGGSPTPASRAVLERLGDVVDVGGPAVAAALKLVAIGALGDCLLDTRAALRRGRAAGLDRATTVEVLEHSPLGGLVRAKRSWLLDSDPSDTEFAVGALAKDLALLEGATGVPHRAAGLIRDLTARRAVTDDDDIATLCTATPSLEQTPGEYADARLTVDPTVTADDEVIAPLHAYALGHATGSPEHFRRAFRPTAHIEGVRDGSFTSWDLDTYCRLFAGPAADEPGRSRLIDQVRVTGTVATASMVLRHGEDRFRDLFLLVRDAEGWRIANKVYHRDDA